MALTAELLNRIYHEYPKQLTLEVWNIFLACLLCRDDYKVYIVSIKCCNEIVDGTVDEASKKMDSVLVDVKEDQDNGRDGNKLYI